MPDGLFRLFRWRRRARQVREISFHERLLLSVFLRGVGERRPRPEIEVASTDFYGVKGRLEETFSNRTGYIDMDNVYI